jgi:TolB-like protein/Tfp pilus assembly protein PilF
VYKVGIAYLVLAWVVVQVTNSAIPALHLPEWVNSLVFLLGAIGLPFALFFAWAFEITPDGVKRESEIAPEESIVAHTGRKLDFAIIALLVVALGYFIYESRFAASPEQYLSTKNTATTETPQNASNELEGTSIAVLPFVNMSSDKEQEYFTDGISEEILNVLAKIPKLHVTSRSSAFAFKGSKINISEVAAKLGVKNVLEGSVRKSGNQIRITAQLIEAGSDKHLWSDTYDRELTDIFAVQDEISAAIVKALKAKLGLNAKVVARDMSKVNLDAHNEYLQGRFFIEKRNQKDIEKSLIHFDKAIALAPDYALAWMGKGWASLFLGENNYGDIPVEIAVKNARPAIVKALTFDPELPEAHAIMGLIEVDSFNTGAAILNFEKAIALNPNYADAFTWYANQTTQPKKRFELRLKAVKLSPMSVLVNINYGLDLATFGKIKEAQLVVQRMMDINPSHQLVHQALGRILLIEGNYADAIIAFETQIKNAPENVNVRFNAAEPLAAIGLNEKATTFLEGTMAEASKYWFSGDLDSYISHVRANFPRYDDDSLGNWARAMAEAQVENYDQASKYYKLLNMRYPSFPQIYSYQQVGDIDLAQTLLNTLILELTQYLDADVKFIESSPIEIKMMEVAYLAGNIDEAMERLKQAMAKNYILHFDYQKMPMFQKLWEHKEWPAILAESNKRAAIQRDLYLKLSAED